MKYEAQINGQWVKCSAEKLLFFLIPLGICSAYRKLNMPLGTVELKKGKA